MSGATIVFAPRLWEILYELLPMNEDEALSSADLIQKFPDNHQCSIANAMASLKRHRLAQCRKEVIDGHVHLKYWRLP